MKFKYIMLCIESPIPDTVRVIPFLFFEPITHVEMFKLACKLPGMEDATLRSAGFVTISIAGIGCYGESTSLKDSGERNHKALPDDEKIILHYNYMNGVL